MKKLPPWLGILLLFLGALPGAAQVEKSLYKLGLVSGDQGSRNENESQRRFRAAVLNAATDAFVASRRFTMVERAQLDAVFTEKNLQEFIGGQVNNKLTDVLGLDLVGVVDYTVESTESADGQRELKCIIDVRLIDVKSASILATLSSDRPSMSVPSTARAAGQLLYESIRDAFPPLGYVVSVNGKEVVVDLGSDSGVKKGDTLEIVQEGEQIIHPVTGKLLSSPMKVVGKIKVVSVSPQVSICKAPGEEVALASLVRLQGSRTLLLDWAAKIPWGLVKGAAAGVILRKVQQ